MKKLAIFLLAAVLLWGCAAEPAQTTQPVQTTVPVETTIPETTVPETTVPETAVPETTVPAVAQAPITAEFAEESFNAYHIYWSEETEYLTSLGFTASETLTDVQFEQLTWNESESYEAEVLYTIDTMTPNQGFLAQVTFWGDMTTYGISFTDANGASRHYAIMISGKDGSLICEEYTP